MCGALRDLRRQRRFANGQAKTERRRHAIVVSNAQQPERIAVTVIIPACNAEGTIGVALDSIKAQLYEGPMEVIVADGSDSQATSKAVRERCPGARMVPNPERTTSNGLNAALKAAAGRVVVRCDSHAALPPDYVRRAVEKLQKTGAAVVGGRQLPVGETLFERAVGMAITTPLGAGDACYRLGGKEGTADTLYLGVFRRDALDAAGGFDSRLASGEDTELNWRLRKRGETVWFDPSLSVFYRPRSTLRALARQYFRYGRWKIPVLRRHPAELRLRHLASPLLTSGLAASALLGLAGAVGAAATLPLLYAATLMLASIVLGVRRRDAAALLLPAILPTMHISWGLGFLIPARKALANASIPSSETAARSNSKSAHSAAGP